MRNSTTSIPFEAAIQSTCSDAAASTPPRVGASVPMQRMPRSPSQATASGDGAGQPSAFPSSGSAKRESFSGTAGSGLNRSSLYPDWKSTTSPGRKGLVAAWASRNSRLITGPAGLPSANAALPRSGRTSTTWATPIICSSGARSVESDEVPSGP